MKLLIATNTIQTTTLLSIVYVVATLFLPQHQVLLWLTTFLIIINYGLSFTYLFQQGTISYNVILLNVVQLVLYGRLHAQIHDILGSLHYSYNHYYIYQVHWHDWVKFILAHVLHAVDLIDALSNYGIELQNLKPRSLLAKMLLLSMHIMVDIFLWSGIFMYFQRRQLVSTPSDLLEIFKDLSKVMKQARLAGLEVAIALILFMGIINHWSFQNWLQWPLEQVLRTLDFGDAFQVFDWQLHTLRKDGNLVTIAVFLQLGVSLYVLEWVHRVSLYLLKGRGQTITELILIATSPDYSKEEQHIAVKALVRFGTLAVPPLIDILANTDSSDRKRIIVDSLAEIGPAAVQSVPYLVKLLIDTDERVRWATSRTLPRIIPNWLSSDAIRPAIPHLVRALEDPNPEIRLATVRTLGKIGHLAIQAVSSLVKTVLEEEDMQVRKATILALRQMGPAASEAVVQLIEVLVNGTDQGRLIAAEVLGALGTVAAPAIPILKRVSLTDWDGNVRLAAEQALKEVREC